MMATLPGACTEGGGPRGLHPPPPLEIEKQKKKSSEQILSYFAYNLLLFSRKHHFLSYFLSWVSELPFGRVNERTMANIGKQQNDNNSSAIMSSSNDFFRNVNPDINLEL